MLNFLHKHRFNISISIIILLAILVRFYNFNVHYGLGNDDSRDVMIAREALRRHELPSIGPFSSAGPFVFGPLYYWAIMLSIALIPNQFIAPWIFIGIMSVLTVIVLMRAAYLIKGERFSLLIGVLAALSPQMVGRALTLGPHSYISLVSSLVILNYILLWQRKKIRYAIYSGFILGIGVSMHYQAINLLIFFPATLLVPKISLRNKILMLGGMFLAFLIPSLPLLLWDARQNFANTRNILDYLLIGQYRLYVPNSWKIFLTSFLPTYWAFVIGSFKPIGSLLMVSTGIFLFRQVIKKQLPSVLTMLSSIFLCLIIVNRYYHGERSEGYLLYIQPFILFLTGYAIYLLIAKLRTPWWYDLLAKTTGLSLLFLALLGNLLYLQTHINYHSNVADMEKTVSILKHQFPNQKFSVYDYQWQSGNFSQPLSFILEKQGLADPKGLPIGFNCQKGCVETYPTITTIGGLPIVDLRTATNLKDEKTWMNVNQPNLYDDLMRWSKKQKLKSSFKVLGY